MLCRDAFGSVLFANNVTPAKFVMKRQKIEPETTQTINLCTSNLGVDGPLRVVVFLQCGAKRLHRFLDLGIAQQ